jgi:hypothetical protein
MSFTFDTPAVDEFEEMVSYRKDVTGIDCTVFISPRGIARHSPRITIGLGLDPRGNIATVTFDGTVIGAINPQLVRQVQRFVELNRAVLLDYWFYRIDTKQLQQRLQSI